MPRSDAERVRHLVQINRWNFNYHFGVNEFAKKETPDRTGPYTEHRQIWLEGAVLRPSVKAPHGRIICFPETALIGASKGKRAVGHVEYSGKDYSAHLSFPADMLGPILTMLSSGRYQYVTFEADKGRTALIYNFSFREHNDEGDF